MVEFERNERWRTVRVQCLVRRGILSRRVQKGLPWKLGCKERGEYSSYEYELGSHNFHWHDK